VLNHDALRVNGAEGPIMRGSPLPRVYRGRTLADALRTQASGSGHIRQLFWSDGVTSAISLAELDRAARHFARALASLGIVKGDRVAVQMPNRIESAVAYRACLALGAVLTPVVHIYGAAELTFVLQQSQARVLIVPDRWRSIDFQQRVSQTGDCPDLRHIIVVGNATLGGALSYADLMASDHAAFDEVAVDENDPALLLYTSGTTAAPKGVLHSSRTLLSELDQRLACGENSRATTFSAWPAGHIGGFSSLLNPQLTGGPSVIMDRWSPEDGVRLMAEHRVERTAGVPVFLSELLDYSVTLGSDLSSLTSYMSGAANVPPALVERAAQAGIAVFRCYGSTEHPTITASRPSDPLHARAYTDGPVLPGGEVRLLDADDRDVAGTGEGEIVTRGAERFDRYTDDTLTTAAFTPDGWFRTGDIGRFDNGLLIITDRKKDIIIRGGENISSKEVEDVLARHPAVREAAAFSVPHPRLGEAVCAAVQLREGASLTLAEVNAHFIAAQVARQKIPERIEVLAELPRTPSGKVKKNELRARFGGG